MKRTALALIAVTVLASASGPAAAGPPVTKEQVLTMVRQKVDTKLIVSLVQKDCVSFEVSGSNLAELSQRLPAEVLQAAMDCRKGSAAVVKKAPPAAAPTPTGPYRVKEIRKIGDKCCLDELRYPCDVPGKVWVQERRPFGRTELWTLDVATAALTPGPPPCSNRDARITDDEEGPADVSPSGQHRITRSEHECGYMDSKCELHLDGRKLEVDGADEFKYPQWVWIDEETVLLTNFGGLGGGPDGYWIVKVGP
jgi:hypothetical protein